ncbi:MAG TPA: MltA domain-containing protein [Methylibium sp.]
MVHQTTKTKMSRAPSASRNNSSMMTMTSGSQAPRSTGRGAWAAILGPALAAVLTMQLTGCGTAPPAPVEPPPPAAAVSAPASAPALPPILRPASRWLPARWEELPGWGEDAAIQAWPALLRSCGKPAPGWEAACASALGLADPDETKVRAWLTSKLQPYRIEALDGQAEGLMTGYFEPLVEASHKRTTRFSMPLYMPPSDYATRKPWWTRAEVRNHPEARTALRGHEIAWVADPLDALLLQIQGSGRLRFAGESISVRLAFAGHNDQPYKSIGRWLVDQGAFTLEQANWPAIKAWARANPGRVQEMLDANPRFIFFRTEPLPDPTLGPLGAQGVPLTPGRSIAVDKTAVPYGTPVWVATTEPQPWSRQPPPPRPLQRLMMAQDTGSAITGALRADYFWGWTEGAEDRAGRMKQPLRMWALWPRS